MSLGPFSLTYEHNKILLVLTPWERALERGRGFFRGAGQSRRPRAAPPPRAGWAASRPSCACGRWTCETPYHTDRHSFFVFEFVWEDFFSGGKSFGVILILFYHLRQFSLSRGKRNSRIRCNIITHVLSRSIRTYFNCLDMLTTL